MNRLVWVWVMALLLLPVVARAEGPLSGGTRVYIAEEPIGPFTVASFAAPNPPVTTDRLWVTVQLRDGPKAVTDARVWVTVAQPEAGLSERLEAKHELAAAPFDYTAAFEVPATGIYEVVVETEHPQGGGQTRYTVTVSKPLTNYILLVMAVPALLVTLALVHRFALRLPAPAAVLVGDDEPLAGTPSKDKP